MFFGIPAPIIRKRNEATRIENAVRRLDGKAYCKVLTAYFDYYNTPERYKFNDVCEENGIDPADFVAYMNR